MAITITKRVLGQVHHYDEMEMVHSGASSGRQLPKSEFVSKGMPSGWSRSEVVSNKSTPPWWSPFTENMPAQYTDLALLAELADSSRWVEAGNAWLGVLASPRHRILLRRKGAPASPWLFPLANLPKSACVFWPAQVSKVEHSKLSIASPKLDSKDIIVMPILALGAWEAQAFSWRSLVWQAANLSAAAFSKLSAGVFAFLEGTPRPLVEIAAESGFWALPTSTLGAIGEHIGAESTKSDDEFDTMLKVVRAALPAATEAHVLEIAQRTLGTMRAEMSSCVDQLLDMDESAELLEPDDRKDFMQERKAAVCKNTFVKEFSSSLVARRAQASATSSGKAAKAQKKNAGYKGLSTVPAGEISQTDAKLLVPAGGFTWRGVTVGCWAGHFPPNPRTSYAWRRYGERQCCDMVLRDLWARWCEAHGVQRQEVPLANLWDDAGPEGLRAGASSSSTAPPQRKAASSRAKQRT